MQDFDRAFQHQQTYISLKDSITSEKYMQRLAVLEAELELSEKQAHIDALTQEQQLQQEALKRQANLRNFILAGLGFKIGRASCRERAEIKGGAVRWAKTGKQTTASMATTR